MRENDVVRIAAVPGRRKKAAIAAATLSTQVAVVEQSAEEPARSAVPPAGAARWRADLGSWSDPVDRAWRLTS